ncbi:MAG: hypothetical protein ABR530_10050 [Pyrinomonadaceae bacterium]
MDSSSHRPSTNKGTDTVHGVLIDVAGVGVLITGEAGTGKSECALGLLARRHRLVADDVVEVRRRGEDLLGSAPARFAGVLEVRDLGIVDVRELFGPSSFVLRHKIDVCIHLNRNEEGDEGERFPGMTGELNILGINIRRFSISSCMSRDVCLLVETASKMVQNSSIDVTSDLVREHDRQVRAASAR